MFVLFYLTASVFSMIGAGGGILFMPLLIAAGLSFQASAATSLTVMIAMTLTSSFIFHNEKLVDWKVLLFLEPFSMLGAFLGARFSGRIPDNYLEFMFGLIMIISAFFMSQKSQPGLKTDRCGGFGYIKSGSEGHTYCINLWIGAPLMFATGVLASLLGVGGGFAKVPVMKLIFGVPIKTAVATSSTMIMITALTAAATYSFSGLINYKLVLLLGAAVSLGAFTGSRMAIKADKVFLNRLVALIQLLTAVYMFYRAFLTH